MNRFEFISGLDFDKMAEFLNDMGDCGFCVYFIPPSYNCKGKKCLDGIKAWLSTEVDEQT